MMQCEQGRISAGELMTLIFSLIIGTSLLINPGYLVGHDAWLAVLVGLGEGLIIIYIYLILAQRFKGKNLVEINDLIFGSFLGKCVSFLYLVYFLILGSLILRNFGDFFVDTIYQETPLSVFIITFALVGASAVQKGLEVIARLSLMLVPVIVLFFLINDLFLLNMMDFNNLLPVLDVSWQEFLRASHATAVFPFGETVVFLMVWAFVVRGKRKIANRVFFSVFIAGLFLSMTVAINIMVLGVAANLQTYPSLITIRLIDIGQVLTRVEIITITLFVIIGFLKFVLVYYVTVLGFAQIFKLHSYVSLVYPIGVIMVVLSIISFENTKEMLNFAYYKYPYYALPFQLALPLLSLIVAAIRGVRVKS